MLPLKSTMPATATSTQPPDSRLGRDDLLFEESGAALGSLGSLGRQRELIIARRGISPRVATARRRPPPPAREDRGVNPRNAARRVRNIITTPFSACSIMARSFRECSLQTTRTCRNLPPAVLIDG